MILVDSSVWIRHLAIGETRLMALLQEDQVLVHPFVVGELACGFLREREETLSYLDRLEPAPVADDEEARSLVEQRRLIGRGLGWVDIHLLASCLRAGVTLWSHDRRLVRAAEGLGVAA